MHNWVFVRTSNIWRIKLYRIEKHYIEAIHK